MLELDLEQARGSLARGLARQAMEEAAQDDADTARILNALHDVSPNLRSRRRFAARMKQRRGVVQAAPTRDGLVVVLRTVLLVDVRKDGVACYTEERIAWTRVRVITRKQMVSFDIKCIHASRHALQRRVERSDCALGGLLGQMDAAMLRALSHLARGAPLRDRDDAYLPARAGVWAGGPEQTTVDPAWGAAFRHAAPLGIFAIRTFLGEAEMRPTVWLGWSEASGVSRAA